MGWRAGGEADLKIQNRPCVTAAILNVTCSCGEKYVARIRVEDSLFRCPKCGEEFEGDAGVVIVEMEGA